MTTLTAQEQLCLECPLEDCKPHSKHCPYLQATRRQRGKIHLHLVPPAQQLSPEEEMEVRVLNLMELCDSVLEENASLEERLLKDHRSPIGGWRGRPYLVKAPLAPAAVPFVEPVYKAVLNGARTHDEIVRAVPMNTELLKMVLEYLIPRHLKTRDVEDGTTIYFPPRHVRRHLGRDEKIAGSAGAPARNWRWG